MTKPLRVLIVEDSDDDAELLLRELRRNGLTISSRRVQTADAMRAALSGEVWDLILSDYAMPEFSAPEALKVARQESGDIPFIIISGTIGEEVAVDALKAGAHDFLVKGRLARLFPAIQRELRDATFRRERREALARAEERERRLSAMFNQVAVGMIWTDLAGRVQQANQRFCDMVGLPTDEVSKRSLDDLTHPDDAAANADAYRRIAQGERSVVVEARCIRPDGSALWVSNTISVVVDADGQPVYAVGIVLDMTEQKHAEALRMRGVELEGENRRIQEANRLKSEFLASMSHELRTPLNSIIGFAEMMHDGRVGPISDEHVDFLGDILTSARHLLQLINDILDLSKVEAGKLELHPEPSDVGMIVAEVAAVLRAGAAEKQICVRTQVDPALGTILIDAGRLKQVLYNYLSNALKFTPARGTVTARALVEDATTFRIEVEDTGPGISPEGMHRLFLEFEQLDGNRHGGTGLGLALTKRLVEAQGGSVGARSELGTGSVFYASLPRQARSGAALPTPRVIPGAQPDARVVLVVEDVAEDQDTLVRTLTQAGYAVETAATRTQALARCRERTFDAITLDLLLPDASGLKVLEEIRANSRNKDVPVLVVSVAADRAMVAGFAVHDVLSKPLDPNRLLASLKRASAPPGGEGYILVVDDDPGSMGVMQTTLAQLGYRTSCVADGESGLRAADGAQPLAVILDLMMPGMNGFEFLGRFRSARENRHVPVLIWTLKDLTADEEAFLRASAQGIVKKETAWKTDLVEEIRALCDAQIPHAL